MIWIVIILLVMCGGGGIAPVVRWNIFRDEQKRYYQAAARMIKESCLDAVIASRGSRRAAGKKLMLYLTTSGRPRGRFVFDPEKGVRVGRNRAGNDICIQDAEVSAVHCCVYLYQDRPVVQDFNSSNGTWIKRGMKKHAVRGAEYIFSGDSLLVGHTKLKIHFFELDMIQL